MPGAIAQLGERYNGIVEVGGSNPPGSTKPVSHSQEEHSPVSVFSCAIRSGAPRWVLPSPALFSARPHRLEA